MHRSHLNVNKVAEGAEGSRVEVRELRYSVRWFGDRSANCGWCRITRYRDKSMTASWSHVDLMDGLGKIASGFVEGHIPRSSANQAGSQSGTASLTALDRLEPRRSEQSHRFCGCTN